MRNTAIIGNGRWSKNLQKYIPKYFRVKYIVNSKFDLDIIWDDNTIDTVFIVTPIETHYELIRRAIFSGKDVFVEKTVTETYEQARSIQALEEHYDSVVFVDYTMSFSPSLNFAQESIDKIGTLEYIKSSSKKFLRNGHTDVFKVLGSHHLSIFSLFFDLKEIDFKRYDFNGKVVGDKFISDSGILLSHSGVIDVNLKSGYSDFKTVLYGSKGCITYTPKKSLRDDSTLLVFDYETEERKSYSFDEDNNLELAIREFIKCVNGERESNLGMAVEINKIIEV